MTHPQAPSTARMADYWLGGKHHHSVDVAAPQVVVTPVGDRLAAAGTAGVVTICTMTKRTAPRL